MGHRAGPAGAKTIARRTTAPDSRAKIRLRLGEAPELAKVNEHGEFTRGTMAEARSIYRLESFGRIFGVTRQALVNDDLDAFGRLVGSFGQAAMEFEAAAITSLLYGTAGVGPVMEEGSKALFHADHGNLAAAGAAVDVASLGAARTAMRLQTGLAGRPIDVTLRYLLVPAELETDAEKVLATISAAQVEHANPFSDKLVLVVEPRLDALDDGAWYLAAAESGIEYAYLEGAEGPQIDSRAGFDVDGLELRCRLDFGAGVLDHRGLYLTPAAPG